MAPRSRILPAGPSWRNAVLLYSVQGILVTQHLQPATYWGIYNNNLAWAPAFYSEQYGLNIKVSAFLSILMSVADAVDGFVAGL